MGEKITRSRIASASAELRFWKRAIEMSIKASEEVGNQSSRLKSSLESLNAALYALEFLEDFRWCNPAVELPLEIGDKGERIVLVTTMDGEVYPAKFFYNSCDVQKWIVVRGIGWSYPSDTELLEKLPGTCYEAVKAWCYLPEWEE